MSGQCVPVHFRRLDFKIVIDVSGLLLIIALDNPPVCDVECAQVAKNSKLVQCQWGAPHITPYELTVSDFTGHMKEGHVFFGQSVSWIGLKLKNDIEYTVKVGRASTEIILRGKLMLISTDIVINCQKCK